MSDAEDTEALPWHTALVLALTGEHEDLGRQSEPDVDQVVKHLQGRQLGHHGVPAELMNQLPAARFAALAVTIRRRLSVEVPPPRGPRVLDAHDRRLAADRPPHWG